MSAKQAATYHSMSLNAITNYRISLGSMEYDFYGRCILSVFLTHDSICIHILSHPRMIQCLIDRHAFSRIYLKEISYKVSSFSAYMRPLFCWKNVPSS
mmetsp:Transcript_30594/g.39286  ORF Transcript_30594/g.39286 Transcript_30594/m.39286 type:complete len:98 (-) Transcript_30594:883-1176(-)